jgi:hypothetical protein
MRFDIGRVHHGEAGRQPQTDMTDYVFLGPTLPLDEARNVLPAEYLPPAGRGDIYRIGLSRPRAIGIIDGYFGDRPSVLHKEILWALSLGIHVYGAASMGALRAAEMAPFGMRGVGRVFEAYRSGELTDDDEVAVAHAPAELQFEQLSVAMVNVRRTLAAASDAGVIAVAARGRCEAIAKKMFFADRTYDGILAAMEQAGIAGTARLRDWIATGSIDQKALDAKDMLEAMKADMADHVAVGGGFVNTIFWDRLIRELAREPVSLEANSEVEIVLDELRLSPKDYARAFEGALLQELVSNGFPPNRHTRVAVDSLNELRAKYGLMASGIGAVELLPLASNEQSTLEVLARIAPVAERGLVSVVIKSGQYNRLLQRGLDKRRCLANDRAPYSTEEIRQSFEIHFREIGGVPDDLDQWARTLGFASEADLGRAVIREVRYKGALVAKDSG